MKYNRGTDINQDAIDDFYAFLSKINIQNGNGSQIEFLDDGGQGDLSTTWRNGSNRVARRQHLRTVCRKFGLLLFIPRHKRNRLFQTENSKSEQTFGIFQNLWFERRQLTWEGLTNIFDDLKVERLAKKQRDI